MTDQNFEYECALSGLTAPGGDSYEGDGLDDLPEGWIEVRMTRRFPNPHFMAITETKRGLAAAALQGIMAQMPENAPAELRLAQEVAISLQLDAQFFLLEQNTPPYLTETEVVYLADPEMSKAVKSAVNTLREMVGLEPLAEPSEAESEESDE